jgi:quercetin dioxygenase-like cupin family protein
MIVSTLRLALLLSVLAATSAPALAQAVAGPEKARPVQGDPGISSMVVINEKQFRVLRDYAEPNATRRMHNHADATYHVFVLVTGRLLLTVEGEPPVEVGPGEALSLKGGVMHTFRNTGAVTATIVEVFGKGPNSPADLAAAEQLARALAPPGRPR